jgi:uncharacterized protein YbjQ (UPF0145 family)
MAPWGDECRGAWTDRQRRERMIAMDDEIIITTMNDIPGYRVTAVYGEVFGLITRSRNVFSNIGAGLRTIVGGEVRGWTKLLTRSREQAIERLQEATRERGGNAVIAMRFDASELGAGITEVVAYGTAVTIAPQ